MSAEGPRIATATICITDVHKTLMQHFYEFFRECRFCPCCKLIQWLQTESYRYQVILLGDIHRCEQLAHYTVLPRVGFEPTT